MRKVFFYAVPFVKEEVTLALEAGIDGLIVPPEEKNSASSLARGTVLSTEEITALDLESRDSESEATQIMKSGRLVLLRRGWEIIPVENLLAHEQGDATKKALGMLALEVLTVDEAKLATGILEKGVDTVVVPPESVMAIRDIVATIKHESGSFLLDEAIITEIVPVGIGHRVCVDTLSNFTTGQGMLVGNSAAFTFLVNAETEHNEYVASRPFRVNAGAVHAYAAMPGDRTSYLQEIQSGSEVLIVDENGNTSTAIVGRVKVEKRPMLLIKARSGSEEGSVFLQNAETIRMVQPGGKTISVVALQAGDKVLCKLDVAGRHFGMRISEEISEG